MIDAKQLMINNWVIINTGNKYERSSLHQIDSVDISVAFENPERFSPIILCHEVFIKCGFTEDGLYCYSKGNFKITEFIKGKYCLKSNLYIHVEYLHNLQNLFSFTTDELNYKK
jgi:hypothetical protein